MISPKVWNCGTALHSPLYDIFLDRTLCTCNTVILYMYMYYKYMYMYYKYCTCITHIYNNIYTCIYLSLFLQGIFPSSFIHIKECTIVNSGYVVITIFYLIYESDGTVRYNSQFRVCGNYYILFDI